MPVNKEIYCRCLYYSANALARKMTRMAEEEFKAVGFQPSYGFVLMTVNKQPGINIGEIAEIMQLRPSTVTRFVDRLEREGFLLRKTDGKYIHIFPTDKSKKADAELRTAWSKLYQRYSLLLGEQEGNALTALVYDASMKFK